MRMRWRMALLAPVLLGAAPGRPGTAGELEALGFMSGCWRGPAPEGAEIEESWTEADADAMFATTRYLRDGRVMGWEFSRIHADSTGTWLTPYPRGEKRSPFRLDRAEGGIAIFSNPDNDFPQTIIYRGDGETGLVIRLEGGGTQEWRMRAVECAG